jgi:hypothetical protein
MYVCELRPLKMLSVKLRGRDRERMKKKQITFTRNMMDTRLISKLKITFNELN